MEQKRKANYDFLIGLVTIALGIVYGIMAYMLKRSPVGNPLSPSIFPLILAAGMVILGIVVTLRSNLAELRETMNMVKAKATDNDRKSNRMIVISVVSGLLYALMFKTFGYVISTFVFIMINLYNTEKEKLVRNIIISVIFSFTVYYLFFYVLGISLPMMPFINW